MSKHFPHLFWIIPLLLWAILTPFTPSLDLTVSKSFFYNQNSFENTPFLDLVYRFALFPAWFAVIGSLGVLLGSLFFASLKKWQAGALVMVLSLAIGSGFITHLILKDHWGRPRPKQIIEFGGQQHFRPYYSPNFFHQSEPSKSFPCGHCTMGFYFFALATVGKMYRSKSLYYAGTLLAWTLGITLSYARIAQGGHFLSDVVVSALIMWLTPLTLSYWIYYRNERINPQTTENS